MPAGNIDSFISASFRVPVLTVEEELTLARSVRDDDDREAAHRLVMSHIRFVVRIARGYTGYGLPLADLIQEGSVGLMKAVKRFDPELGVRLVSFAVHWIRAEIHEYILRNWRIVKIATTKAQRKLFFNLRSSKRHLGWFTQEEVEAVASDLGVPSKTVLEMESRLANHDMAFDGSDSDDDDAPAAPAEYVPDNRMEPAREIEQLDSQAHERERLFAALDKLDDRSKTILQQRWLGEKKVTLSDLAKRFGVSAERIRQIEKAALIKMRGEMAFA